MNYLKKLSCLSILASSIIFSATHTAQKRSRLENDLKHATDLLVQGGVAAADEYGSTALTIAVKHPEAINFIKVLLDAKADVSAVDRYGSTPLDIATALGNVEAVKLLLKAKGDPDKGSDGGSKQWARRAVSHFQKSDPKLALRLAEIVMIFEAHEAEQKVEEA